MPEWDWTPFYPGGTVQSKVTDGTMAAKLAFWGQFGHAGVDFLVEPFLKEHKEYEWMRRAGQGYEMRPVEPVRRRRRIWSKCAQGRYRGKRQ